MNFFPFALVVVEDVQRRGGFPLQMWGSGLAPTPKPLYIYHYEQRVCLASRQSNSLTARSLVLQDLKLWLDGGWIEHEGVKVHTAVSLCEARWKWTEQDYCTYRTKVTDLAPTPDRTIRVSLI